QTALDATLFWQQVPDGVGTVVAVTGPRQTTVTPFGSEFAAGYMEIQNRWPESYAFAAYDALWLITHAAINAPTLTGPDLTATLEASDVELAAGRYYLPYSSANPPESEELAHLWHQWPDVHMLYLQYAESGQVSDQMPIIWPPSYRTAELSR